MTHVEMKVAGVEPFRAAVDDTLAGLPKTLDDVFEDAADVIVAAVRPMLPVRSGSLRASLRAVNDRVVLGASVPYAGWADFGGNVGRRKTIRRPFIRGGRYLYPAISKRWRDIRAACEDGVDRLTDRTGLR